jgi:predicted CoA-binding protein
MNKHTLVVGASLNPARYSHLAINRLLSHDQPVMAYGLREGEVAGVPIETDQEAFLGKEIDTITLYVGSRRQEPLMDWIVQLAPRRVIFNPGTENPIFEQKLREAGIEVVIACTLVMLSMQSY